jgi:hypothetical protein
LLRPAVAYLYRLCFKAGAKVNFISLSARVFEKNVYLFLTHILSNLNIKNLAP